MGSRRSLEAQLKTIIEVAATRSEAAGCRIRVLRGRRSRQARSRADSQGRGGGPAVCHSLEWSAALGAAVHAAADRNDAPSPERKTPLLITETTAQGLDLKLTLPAGTKAVVRKAAAQHPRSRYDVQDQSGPGYVHPIRDVDHRRGAAFSPPTTPPSRVTLARPTQRSRRPSASLGDA